MVPPSPISEPFLPARAPLSQKWVALRQNVQSWYSRWAIANGKTEIGRSGDLLWTYSQCTIPSEESLIDDDQQIDDILNWYRRQEPQRGAIFWYLNQTPPVPARLAAKLYAHGVGPNWEPHWMWCELDEADDKTPANPPQQEEVRTTKSAAEAFEIRIEDGDLPGEAGDGDDVALATLTQERPQRVWHLVAWQQDSRRLGGCTLNVTTGTHGIGGLFDMWVSEAARKRGIGTALARETCALARRLGCRAVMVNATEQAEGIYRRAGFESIGWGVTWFLNGTALAQPRPEERVVKFLEAVGLGDAETLDGMMREGGLAPELLCEPTLNGMTPLEIAVRCRQPSAASWLVDRGGVVPDIMSVWDLGWKERLPGLLAAHPELVRRRGGRWTATPLHVAIERADMELARLLLTVPNDLEIRDAVFKKTPMEWAETFQKEEFATLLKKHMDDKSA